MLSWKIAAAVFNGGTEEIKGLIGKRVRAKRILLSVPVHDPASRQQGTRDIAAGDVGFVANPYRDGLLIAFPADQHKPSTSLASLLRQREPYVLTINQPTFKQQFEIEI